MAADTSTTNGTASSSSWLPGFNSHGGSGASQDALSLLFSTAGRVMDTVQGGMNAGGLMGDFIDTVRWTEPFIISLLVMQLSVFTLAYVTRRRHSVQFALMIVLTAITLLCEQLNDIGHRHWRKFASQDYFDRQGLFMLIFVSGPFVIVSNFIVIGMGLRLVKVYAKKQQRRHRVQQGNQAAVEGNNSTSSTTTTTTGTSGRTSASRVASTGRSATVGSSGGSRREGGQDKKDS